MVDAYATTLGAATLALNADRFLLEEPHSTAILSLHPAVQPLNAAHPRPFQAVQSFETSDAHTRVQWQTVDGLSASSSIHLDAENRFRLHVELRNDGDRARSLQAFLPLFLAPEVAGACAIGLSGLRTLVADGPDEAPRLKRLQGDDLVTYRFAAWFPRDGRPIIFLGALGEAHGPLVTRVVAARGRIVSLRVEAPMPSEGRLEPGETLAAPPLLIAVGDMPVADAIAHWAREAGLAESVAPWLETFDPGIDLPETEEVAASTADAEDPDWFDRALVVHEPPEPEPEPELSRYERALHLFSGRRPLAGPAFFQRARRAAEDVWPRWAAGRRHPPLEGWQGRTRQRWRRPARKSDSGEENPS